VKFVFFLIFSVFLFSGCQSGLEKQIWDNIAECREFVMVAKDDRFSISLACGEREIDYKMDGYANELIPFGVITVTVCNIEGFVVDGSRFILYVGTEKYSGNFEQNPFDKTLVADIGVIVDKNKNISIDVLSGEEKYSLKFNKVDEDWCVNKEDCVKILIEQYKKQLKSFCNDVFEGEVYIKIIDDYDNMSSDFYYYVSVIGRGGSSLNILISPKTAEVLASNSNIIPMQ